MIFTRAWSHLYVLYKYMYALTPLSYGLLTRTHHNTSTTVSSWRVIISDFIRTSTAPWWSLDIFAPLLHHDEVSTSSYLYCAMMKSRHLRTSTAPWWSLDIFEPLLRHDEDSTSLPFNYFLVKTIRVRRRLAMTSLIVLHRLVIPLVVGVLRSAAVDPACDVPPGHTDGEVVFMDPHGALSPTE